VPIELYRVDDRLIHGQVVIGWGHPLALRFIVLVDDGVAANDWERELYRMGTPPDVDLFFETVESALARMPELAARPDPGVLLTADVATMDRLCAGCQAIREVNIGGLHHRSGRSPCLPYVFLSTEDEAALKSIAARGVRVIAQDLPASDPVELGDLLPKDGA
jgi:mannose/fructose/N-acetylgalactosamine-specific phosphotransferase system component IIB